jgi:hypothetical protein
MFRRYLSGWLLIAAMGFAQQKPDLAGNYAGALGPLHIKLHLAVAGDGALSGTVDSPDQNMVGVPCSDFHLNGQSLSFTVPMVRGTWIGFVSEDGSTLTGMWNQGSPMPLNLTRSAMTTASAAPASAPARPTPNAEVKWDDYIFKFDRSGTMAQVFEGGKVIGTILTMNGQQQVLPIVTGAEADKLKKSFDDYQAFNARSHGASSSPAVAASATPSAPESSPTSPTATSPSAIVSASPTPAASIRFDDASHTITVPRPDGVTVTFVGNDVKIAGFRRQTYIVRHQKGSAGRFLEGNVGSSRAGGSISGGGEEFLIEGGGIVYDSGMGGYNLQESPQVLLAKQLSTIAVAAVADVRQVSGHESFAPPGYNSLKEISQYRLRSDGSR